jgi:hypothetical protein
MTVNPPLPVSVTITPDANPVEAGTMVTFTAYPVNGGAFPVFRWFVNEIEAASGGPAYSYIPQDRDEIYCLLTSDETCVSGNPAVSNTVVMTVTTLPSELVLRNIYRVTGTDTCYNATLSITVAGDETFFEVQSGASVTLIAGQTILLLPGSVVSGDGYLHAWITEDQQFCGHKTPAIAMVTGKDTELTNAQDSPDFVIYPNPTDGIFRVLSKTPLAGEEQITVEIYDRTGKKTGFEKITGRPEHSFSLTKNPDGMYLIRILCGQDSKTFRLVKSVH